MEEHVVPWWGARPVWWCALSVSALAFATAIVLSLTSGSAAIAYVLASGVWAPLGLILWRRKPDHPMGPLIALVGFLSLSVVPGFLMGAVLEQFEATITPKAWPMVLSLAFSGAYTYLFVLAILLFPEGRPISTVQRVLMTLLLAVAAAATISGLLSEPMGPLHHPFVDEAMATRMRSVYDALTFSFGFALLAVVANKVIDYRRSETVRRAQLKWLIYVLVVYLVFTVISFGIIGIEGFDLTGLILDAMFTGLIPLAMTVAILRYRLYEIDRLVSRTVTYAILVLLLGAIYTVPVLALPALVGHQSDIIVAASTLAAVALFSPIRSRIQRRVDRRFNRASYDTAQEISALVDRMSGAMSAESVSEETLALVQRTLHPSSVGIWVKT
jgi:hypothetical protein